MSLLKAYLAKPSTQRVLNRKPGQKGFSLIELVVVVAVLAILAAVAIPTFSGLTDDARLNTSKQILTDTYKECEYNKVRENNAFRAKAHANQTPSGVTWGDTSKVSCDYTAVATVATGCTVGLDLSNGDTYHDGAKTNWPSKFTDC